MLKMPQPVPYQGSKRNIAPKILATFPSHVERLIEPFAGSAALSLRAAFNGKADSFYLNDRNEPLIRLLKLIVNQPDEIATAYAELWHAQLGNEREFYDEIRSQFNKTHRPDYFLYLLARCVKASVRYNSNGEFNQGPDNRRKGRQPASMKDEIFRYSQIMKGRATFTSNDYRSVLDILKPNHDLIYMDPPYQGTSGKRDSRYCSGLDVAELVDFMYELNQQDVMFALSYDGRKGNHSYGKKLPEDLHLHCMEIDAGRSTQSTLLGRRDVTYESLYLSRSLVERLNSEHSSSSGLDYRLQQEAQLEFNFA